MNQALRVGVYDLYWSTLGGGEQVAGTIASVLADDHDVTLLGPAPLDLDVTRERLGIDLGGCAFRLVQDDADASSASADFDLFVNVTYLSSATNHAACGWYYVHFPGQPPTSRDRLRQWTSVNAARLLDRPGLPQRLADVRAGFERRVRPTGHLATYERFLANSHYTADWVRRLWAVPCTVLYPPVRAMLATGPKRPLVLNVGRFFDPRFGHSKRQLDLVHVFDDLDLDGWELALAGGCDAANREYALAVRRAALGKPIHVHVNARGAVVTQLLTDAAIYWHASGYGADATRHPERFEHFGITVVEAMAAGAVPLVYGAGGPAEIVTHGANGCHWHDLGELASLTARLAREPGERVRLADSARHRAQEFSVGRFAEQVRGLVDGRRVH